MKNNCWVLLVILFVALMAGAADEQLVCVTNSKITIPSGIEVAKVEQSDYCYSTSPWKLVSMNCHRGPCKALQYYNLPAVKQSAIGTVESRLCRSADGKPQTIFFMTSLGDQKFNRCYFEEDESYVDLSTFGLNQTQIELPARDGPTPVQKPTGR